VDAGGNITTYVYDGSGNLTTVTEMLPGPDRVTTYQYDAQGRVTEAMDDLGTASIVDDRYTCYQYDTAGRLTTYIQDTQTMCNSASAMTTTFTYDARGQLVRITDPQGAEAQLTYVPAPGTLLLVVLGLGALARRHHT
jgi:YD repeat-containing protein